MMNTCYKALIWMTCTGLLLSQRQEGSHTSRTVRLEGGQVDGTGNVLIRDGHRWGHICDDGWDLSAAHVLCRMLGFTYAQGFTLRSFFGPTKADYILDDIKCTGLEGSLFECESRPWGDHDCEEGEAAGVYCSTQPAPPGVTFPTVVTPQRVEENEVQVKSTDVQTPVNEQENKPETEQEQEIRHENEPETRHRQELETKPQSIYPVIKPQTESTQKNTFQLRLINARLGREGQGYLEAKFNPSGSWGPICSQHWTLSEAAVACRHLGLKYAKSAPKGTFGGNTRASISNLKCTGSESTLTQCQYTEATDVTCRNNMAAVICVGALPDLVLNATLIESSTYIQDVSMYYLQCALEEGCASSSAYDVVKTKHDWRSYTRRLLRFSSSTWNIGTADFKPAQEKHLWEWHQCHMHYHSMGEFSHYDLLDQHNRKVAEGHKASFCLEDVQCRPGITKNYQCVGFGDQGISVGCADDYLHDIDCQWIDITDVKPGKYLFKIHVNPDNLVAELSYDNNAVFCNLFYSGHNIKVTGCRLTNGDSRSNILG